MWMPLLQVDWVLFLSQNIETTRMTTITSATMPLEANLQIHGNHAATPTLAGYSAQRAVTVPTVSNSKKLAINLMGW